MYNKIDLEKVHKYFPTATLTSSGVIIVTIHDKYKFRISNENQKHLLARAYYCGASNIYSPGWLIDEPVIFNDFNSLLEELKIRSGG